MMCWDSLDDSEQASEKRKMIGKDTETNDDKEMQADKMDDKNTSSVQYIWGINYISLLRNRQTMTHRH